MAGANSIFFGEKLLTTDNPETLDDVALLGKLGMYPCGKKPGTAAGGH